MAIAYFSSLPECEVVDVTFVKPIGGEVTLQLLVDSGFTGNCSFILPEELTDLAHADMNVTPVAGALQGVRRRISVVCRVASLGVQMDEIAILADTAELLLPPGTSGLAGLQFLRRFRQWGAEMADAGDWRFFLATGHPVPKE